MSESVSESSGRYLGNVLSSQQNRIEEGAAVSIMVVRPASQPYMLLTNSKFVCTGGCDLNNNNNHSLLLVGKKNVRSGATTALIPPPPERTVVVPLSWCAYIHTYIVWCASASILVQQHTTVVDCCFGNPGTAFLHH